MPGSSSQLNWAEEKREISPVIRVGLIYGALTGSIIAAFSGFALNTFSPKFRSLPVGLKVILGSGCVITAAIREQDKRMRQYIFLKHWDKELDIKNLPRSFDKGDSKLD